MKLETFLIENNINGFHLDGGTDKASEHSYCPVYEKIFETLKFIAPTKKSILEIGVYQGGWSYTMLNMIPNSFVTGIDIEYKFSPLLKERLIHQNLWNNFDLKIMNAYCEDTVNSLGTYDLIIDDGPHTLGSQVYCIQNYFKLLNPTGIMVIEDIQSIDRLGILITHVLEQDCAVYSYYDLREKKNRWDDIMLVMRKK